MTSFITVYDRFFGKITDDMYLELTPEDTKRDLQSLLIDSIPGFEFPRVKLDFVISSEGEEDASYFESDLSLEEVNIIALLMKNSWLNRQITSIENTRQKAILYHDTVAIYFDRIREEIDKLEEVVDDQIWTLPKYREILFVK